MIIKLFCIDNKGNSGRGFLNTWNLKNKSKFSIEVNPKIKNITCFMYIHCQLNKCVVKWCSHDMNHCYGHNFPVETCLKQYYLITIIKPNINSPIVSKVKHSFTCVNYGKYTMTAIIMFHTYKQDDLSTLYLMG